MFYLSVVPPLVESPFSMMKNTLNEHTTRLDIDTVSSLQTVKYGIKSRAGSAIEYYDDLSFNATQLLVKNMKLASMKRTQEQALDKKRKQDVLDSMNLKRQKFITKVADRLSVEAQAKESRRK